MADTAGQILTGRLARGLLGEGVRTATGAAHACAVCGRPVGRGEREARLPGTEGSWAHVFPCIVRGQR